MNQMPGTSGATTVKPETGLLCPYCNSCYCEQEIEVKEQMIGTTKAFMYYLCANCGSLYRETIDGDMSMYYPGNYYAFSNSANPAARTILSAGVCVIFPRSVVNMLARIPLLGWLISTSPLFSLAKKLNNKKKRIVDVGGGNGSLAMVLKILGYADITVVDAYAEPDSVPDEINFIKGHISDYKHEADIIMYNHAFEHVEDPRAELTYVLKSLGQNGICLIRSPRLPNSMFRKHRANWVQIDAPRHRSIPSDKGMQLLAEACGFTVIESGCDSGPFQFWGSETYEKGLTLQEAQRPSTFRLIYQILIANRENNRQQGDQGWYLLAKTKKK